MVFKEEIINVLPTLSESEQRDLEDQLADEVPSEEAVINGFKALVYLFPHLQLLLILASEFPFTT